jgi:hypothetical protein
MLGTGNTEKEFSRVREGSDGQQQVQRSQQWTAQGQRFQWAWVEDEGERVTFEGVALKIGSLYTQPEHRLAREQRLLAFEW